MESRTAADARTFRNWRGAAKEMGAERARAGRFSGAHQRPANKSFAQERGDDGVRFARHKRPLSLRDRRTLRILANRCRRRKNECVYEENTRGGEDQGTERSNPP